MFKIFVLDAILLYRSEAVGLSATNMHVLDNCINRAMHRIFGIGDCVMYGSCVSF